MAYRYSVSTKLPLPPQQAWEWYRRRGTLERLCAPWVQLQIAAREKGRVTLAMKRGLMSSTWTLEEKEAVPPQHFTEIQTEGPFSSWEQEHRFVETEEGCTLTNDMRFDLPLGMVGSACGLPMVTSHLTSAFAYRQRVMREDLAHSDFSLPRQKILISGATGLVGRNLADFLRSIGHEVWALSRKKKSFLPTIQWDWETKKIDKEALEGFDAVVHLAGDNVAKGRWNEKKKQRIRESRVLGTKFLVEQLNTLKNPPKRLLCASAIGYYEGGFLGEVCKEWEEQQKSYQKGSVVSLRIGVVLTPKGGALKNMLLPFKLGMGGRVATGKQEISWIALDDLIYQISFLLEHGEIEGAVNCTSPNPVTNEELTKTLGKILRRPTILPMPEFAIKTLLGEMGEALLLSSTKVLPEELQRAGFPFSLPTLEEALSVQLGVPQVGEVGGAPS